MSAYVLNIYTLLKKIFFASNFTLYNEICIFSDDELFICKQTIINIFFKNDNHGHSVSTSINKLQIYRNFKKKKKYSRHLRLVSTNFLLTAVKNEANTAESWTHEEKTTELLLPKYPQLSWRSLQLHTSCIRMTCFYRMFCTSLVLLESSHTVLKSTIISHKTLIITNIWFMCMMIYQNLEVLPSVLRKGYRISSWDILGNIAIYYFLFWHLVNSTITVNIFCNSQDNVMHHKSELIQK